MVKNYYHRSFIILKREETGYSVLPGRDPAGYCKLEIRRGRGRIQIYVQDLKPAEQQNGIYEIYLVSEDTKVEPIKLTNINVDERGRGERMVEFNAENINGSGYSLETFHALAVVFKSKDLDGQMKIGYPLVGYSSRNVKVDWTGQVTYYLKGNYTSYAENMNTGKTKDEATENNNNQIEEVNRNEVESLDKQQESTEYEKLQTNEQQEVNQEDEDELQKAYQDTYHEFSEDIPSDILQKDHENEEIEEESSAVKKNNDTVYMQNLKSDTKGDYWDNVKDYFTELFKTHRLIRPFDKDMGDSEWIRVQQQPPMVYPGYYAGPYYNQTYSPYNQMYYNGAYFEHYIVGLIKERNKVKYVVYGIPSMYSMIPPTNMTGFSRWVPVKNGYGMGYWLIYIDASTGCVVYPYSEE